MEQKYLYFHVQKNAQKYNFNRILLLTLVYIQQLQP